MSQKRRDTLAPEITSSEVTVTAKRMRSKVADLVEKYGQLSDDTRKAKLAELREENRKLNLSVLSQPITEQEVTERDEMYQNLNDMRLPQDIDPRDGQEIVESIFSYTHCTRTTRMRKTLNMQLSSSTHTMPALTGRLTTKQYERSEALIKKSAAELEQQLTATDAITCKHGSVFDDLNASFMEAIADEDIVYIENFRGSLAMTTVTPLFYKGPTFYVRVNGTLEGYVLFLCQHCQFFGLYDMRNRRRVTGTAVQQLIDILLAMLRNCSDLINLYRILGSLLCCYAAYRSYIPPNQVPVAPFCYVQQPTVILRSIRERFPSDAEGAVDSTFEWLISIYELMCAMIFMKIHPDVKRRWEAFVQYWNLLHVWYEASQDRDVDKLNLISLIDNEFSGLDLNMALAQRKEHPCIELNLLSSTSSCIFIGDLSWYSDDKLDKEICFTMSLTTIERILIMFDDADYRSGATLLVVLDLILTYFIMLFMLFKWTQGAYVLGIGALCDLLTEKVTDASIGRYAFEYPTPSQFEDYLGQLRKLLMDLIEHKLFSWQHLLSFMNQAYAIRNRMILDLKIENKISYTKQLRRPDDVDGLNDDEDLSFLDQFEAQDDGTDEFGVKDAKDYTDETRRWVEITRERIERLENEFNEMMERIHKLRKEKQQAHDDIMKLLIQESNTLRLRIGECEKETRDIVANIKALNQKIVEQNINLTVHLTEMQKWQQNMKKIEKGQKVLEKKKRDLERVIDNFTRTQQRVEKKKIQLQDVEREITEKREELKAVNADIDTSIAQRLDAELQEKQIHLTSLQKELSEALEAQQTAKLQQQGTQEQINQLDHQIAQAQKDNDDAEKLFKEEGQKLKNEINKVQNATNEYERLINELEKTYTDMETEVLKVEEKTKELLDSLNDATTERDMQQEAAKNALARLLLVKKCECGGYYTNSHQEINNIIKKLGYYKFYMNVRKGRQDPAKMMTFISDGKTMKLVKGLQDTDPEYSVQELEDYAEYWVKMLATETSLNDFERHSFGIVLVCIFYVLKFKGSRFTSQSIENVQSSWVFGLQGKVCAQETVTHQSLSAGFDYVNEKAEMPHLHCNLRSSECKVKHLNAIDQESKTLLGSSVPLHQSSIETVNGPVVCEFYAYVPDTKRAKFFVKLRNTDEIAPFNVLQDLFNQLLNKNLQNNPSNFMQALLIYLVFFTWLKSTDKRVVEMREVMLKALSCITENEKEANDLLVMLEGEVCQKLARVTLFSYLYFIVRWIEGKFAATFGELQEIGSKIEYGEGLKYTAKLSKEVALTQKVDFNILPLGPQWLCMSEAKDKNFARLLADLESLIAGVSSSLSLGEAIMLAEQIIASCYCAFRGATETSQSNSIRKLITSLSNKLKNNFQQRSQSSKLLVEIFNLARAGCLCFHPKLGPIDLICLFEYHLNMVLSNDYTEKVRSIMFNSNASCSPDSIVYERDSTKRHMTFRTPSAGSNDVVQYKLTYHSDNLEMQLNGESLNSEQMKEEFLDCCTRLTCRLAMPRTDFIKILLTMVALYSSMKDRTAGRETNTFLKIVWAALVTEFMNQKGFEMSAFLKCKYRALLVAMKYAVELRNMNKNHEEHFEQCEITLSMIEMPNLESHEIAKYMKPGLIVVPIGSKTLIYAKGNNEYLLITMNDSMVTSSIDITVERSVRNPKTGQLQWVPMRYEDHSALTGNIIQGVTPHSYVECIRIAGAMAMYYALKGEKDKAIRDHLDVIKKYIMVHFTSSLVASSQEMTKAVAVLGRLFALKRDQARRALYKQYIDAMEEIMDQETSTDVTISFQHVQQLNLEGDDETFE